MERLTHVFIGKKLKETIELNNINVYQLAKKAGVDRTTIHKIMSSSRLPSNDFFGRLMDAMPISATEKTELRRCFEISKSGESLHIQREQVKNIIERIAALTGVPTFGHTSSQTISIPKEDTESCLAAYGELSVNNIVEEVVNEAAELHDITVYFFMPHDYPFFFNYLFAKYAKERPLRVKCILEFISGNKSAKRNVNLDVLYTLLPFLLLPRRGFEAFYTYSQFPVRSAPLLGMPYFIIVGNAVLTIAADLKTAFLHRNKTVAETHIHIFNNFLVDAKPLLKKTETLQGLLEHYHSSIADSQGSGMWCVEPQPCLMYYVTPQMAATLFHENVENKEEHIRDLTAYLETLASIGSKRISLFTHEGFKMFVSDGSIAYLPKSFMRSPCVCERFEIIERVINDMKEGTHEIRMINESKFQVSQTTLTDVISGKCINIAANAPGNPLYSHILHINEMGIVNAFDDFFLSVTDTDLVYTREETLAVLEAGKTKLEAKMQ